MIENYKKQVEQEVKRFRNAVTKMQESENPYFTPEVVEYETKQKRAELEQKITGIRNQFNRDIDVRIEEMEPAAAKSIFRPTETDKRMVSEYVAEFLADAKLGYTNDDKLDAFTRFEQRLEHLDENGLHEVRKQLPELFDKLGDNKALQSKLRGLNATFRELQTTEQIELAELKEAKINGIDSNFRTLRLVHPAYSDYKNNRYNK